jgi:MFS family permease
LGRRSAAGSPNNFSWHWIFFINVPIGLISLALVHWLVDEPETLERERGERLAGGLKVDWVGFALIAITLGSLEVVLDRGQIEDWFKSNTIITLRWPRFRLSYSCRGRSITRSQLSSCDCCPGASSAWRFW